MNLLSRRDRLIEQAHTGGYAVASLNLALRGMNFNWNSIKVKSKGIKNGKKVHCLKNCVAYSTWRSAEASKKAEFV